jgi:uncharacterized protein YggU (UPF0235/DUF167 family)
MKIFVTAKTGMREEKVEEIDKSNYIVFVKERPIKNAANKAIIKALSIFFKVQKAKIKLITGKTYREKMFDIEK